jgi:hypothetical protein
MVPVSLETSATNPMMPSKMPIRSHHLGIALAAALIAGGLGGCGTINTNLVGASDYIPQWLGGLPADAPPRPGTAKYDEFMREREQKSLEPAPPKQDAAQSPPSGPDAVH